MTWFRCGGGGSGIPAALKNRMNAVLNKKFGTAVDYQAEGWPDDVNLLGKLEEKTASGTIVTFSDGADDVPTKSLVVTIPPTLSGVSSVTETQTGRNLLVNNGTDISGSGLSFVVNSDKSVTISGVATANAFFTFFENVLFKASSYMIRGSGNSNVQIIVRRGTASGSNIRTASTSDIAWNLAEDTSCACVIRVASGTDLTTPITVYPQIEIGSSLSDYEMAISTTYTADLGRTIYGGQVDIVKGEGSNGYGKITDFSGLTANGTSSTGAYRYRLNIADCAVYTDRQAISSEPLTFRASFNGSVNEFYNASGYLLIFLSQDNVADAIEYLTGVSIVYPLATPTDFTFEGQEVNTRLGYNAFWSEQGDTEVTYRSSGTMTPITPTLITKTITANGSYQAADDSADGYSEVVVNVPQPTPTVDPIMSLNAFVTKSGVSGTNTSTVARSFTMSAAGTLVFASGSYGFTNTGSNEGYFEIQKNGVSVVKQYCNTNTNTPIAIPDIQVEENDAVDLVVGFDNAHSNCSFQFYSAMVVLSEV